MSFPTVRMRRLRRSGTLRRMLRETRLSRDDLILPLFVVEGSSVREPVASMPGVSRFSVDTLVTEAKEVRDTGIPGVILFGIPDEKDARGSGADADAGIVQRAVEAVKSADVVVAVLDGPDTDSGVAFEMGYAYALGVPVVGVRTDFRQSQERGVNLMCSRPCAQFVCRMSFNESIEELAAHVARKMVAAAKSRASGSGS